MGTQTVDELRNPDRFRAWVETLDRYEDGVGQPTARGRGIATAATALMLDECRSRGVDPVLITCDDDDGAAEPARRAAGRF